MEPMKAKSPPKTIGRAFKVARQEVGISRKAMTEKLGITWRESFRYENKNKIPMEIIIAFLKTGIRNSF